jgi:hypothetical protein
VIATIDDALALVGLSGPARLPDADFGDAERAILRELRCASAGLDLLAARTGLPARSCIAAVTALEIAGAVECLLTGEIRAR